MAKQKKNYDVLDKTYITNQYKIQAFNKLFAMFKYSNLPETIPQRNLEKILLHGYACIAKVDEKLYAFEGGLGGEPDVYYNPTICTVTNPALNLSKDFVIDKDCIIIRNDSNMQGMDFLVDKFSSAMCENDITSYLAGVNNRLTMILSAGDNRTKEAAEKFLKDIAQGKLAVVAENTFLETLNVHTLNYTNRAITDCITQNQYLRACFLNDIGLQANTQLKKERLVSSEVEINTTSLYPIVDDMLQCRKEGLEKVNQMFGTNIEVEFTSSWDYRVYGGANIENPDNVELPEDDPADTTEVITDEVANEPDEGVADEVANEPDEGVADEETNEPDEGVADEETNEPDEGVADEETNEPDEETNEPDENVTEKENKNDVSNLDTHGGSEVA